jgi:hypothetical protein
MKIQCFASIVLDADEPIACIRRFVAALRAGAGLAAVDRELPFEPKIPFITRVRMSRDDWDEKSAGFDLAANR